MLDTILINDLAVSPPQIWSKRVQQAAVIAPLALSSKVGISVVDNAADLLNVDRRQIYRLIEQRRTRLKGAPPYGYSTGLQYVLDAQTETLIAMAIADAGSAARLRDVEALVRKKSAEQGIECPNSTAIRTRFGKRRENVDLLNRLELNCDLIIDICRLDLAVRDGSDTAKVAWILGLFEANTSHIRSHKIFAGKPIWSDIQDFISSNIPLSEVERPDLRIAFTGEHLFDESSIQISGQQINFSRPSDSRKVIPAEAFRALFGTTVGRIFIRSKASDAEHLNDPVDLAIARAILNRIIVGRK